jgi:hypothetical protein
MSYLQLNNPLRALRHGEKALRQLVLSDLSRFVQMDLDMRKAQCSCPRLRKQCDNEDRSVVQYPDFVIPGQLVQRVASGEDALDSA